MSRDATYLCIEFNAKLRPHWSSPAASSLSLVNPGLVHYPTK